MDRRPSTSKTKQNRNINGGVRNSGEQKGLDSGVLQGDVLICRKSCGAGTQHSPSITPSCTLTPQTWRGREPPVGGELQVLEEQSRDGIPEQEAGAGWEESGNVPTSLQIRGGRWIPQC